MLFYISYIIICFEANTVFLYLLWKIQQNVMEFDSTLLKSPKNIFGLQINEFYISDTRNAQEEDEE